MIDLKTKLNEIHIVSVKEAIENMPFRNIDLSQIVILGEHVRKDIFAEKKRKAWGGHQVAAIEARCDFTYRLRMTRRASVNFISIWQKSLVGRTLTDIKADDSEVGHFAESIVPVIKECVGHNLSDGSWCICTSPKRRHKEKNFATRISEQIGDMLGIPFYEDVALCDSRQRIGAVFHLNFLPEEPNIIVFDDFVTTGSTLQAMKNLLAPLGKNLVFFTGVNNIL